MCHYLLVNRKTVSNGYIKLEVPIVRLRKLELKDADKMLTWMLDDSVVHYMGADFSKKTITDCETFILSSHTDSNNLHMAIVNDDDQYQGTVSLKNINRENSCAEFAIAVTKEAMGKGYSKYGMHEIIKIGLEALMLNQIYWYVSPQNKRAIKFYDKNGFTRIFEIPDAFKKGETEENIKLFHWYIVYKQDYMP